MTVFSTTNSTALEILKGVAARIAPEKQTPTVPRAGRPLEPSSNASMQAAAMIAAIINETGGEVDLSTQQYSTASISGQDYATIIGGDVDDSVGAWAHATVRTGNGNDSISVHRYGKVDSGAGDDTVMTYAYSEVAAGDGNDYVYTYNDSVVDAGAGDDNVRGYSRMQVDGGAGNDEIRTYNYSTIDAGEGDDIVVAQGYSTVKGDLGNDTLIDSEWSNNPDAVFGSSSLDGGDGDDYIQASANSRVVGGTGNDMIRLTGENATVTFNRGDGNDAITSRDDFTVNVAGYTKDDVTVTAEGEEFIVSFNGSDETLMLNLSSGATARFVFEDGSMLEVTGTEQYRRLQLVRANSDWSPTSPVPFHYAMD